MTIKLDANRLADKLIDFYHDSEIANVSALMLRQQAKEIEQLKLCELSEEEILETWKKFPNWGNDQHILMFGRELLKKVYTK